MTWCLRLLRLAFSAVVLGAVLGAGAATASEVRDDLGHTLAFSQVPQRVVSLLPSLTETVCALGACQRLVGVDTYSDFPASVQALPHLGGGLNPQIEAVLALHPDLVLLASSSPALERLRGLGLRVLALEPKNHADVRRTVLLLSQIFAADAGPRLLQRMDADMQQLVRELPPSVHTLKVYFEVNRAPYAASESSFIGETLQALGAKNIVPAQLGPFPKLNPEFVVRANPDLILLSDSDVATMAARPGWQSVRAVAAGHVCVFSLQESDVLVRPGPRLVEGARLMAACLRKYLR